MPRSTMLTGISGSWTSRSASRSWSGIDVRLPEPVKLLLQAGDHLGVAWPSGAPAHEHVVPAARVVEVPALALGVERAGEGVVEDVGVTFLMGRSLDADLLAVGHHEGQPPLAKLIVRLALEPVVELRRVGLDAVGQAEPLDGEREHPVDGGL